MANRERIDVKEPEVIDPTAIALAHDAMANEYDTIEDLWYTHLFNQLHEFMLRGIPDSHRGSALDVGCGTGYQSLLLARAGYQVRGFDIASSLIGVAQSKIQELQKSGKLPWPLYNTSIPFFMEAQQRIVEQADALRGINVFSPPEFIVADATDPTSYEPGNYDVIVCYGSVLSFIDENEKVLSLMARALKPGGRLFLEVEQRLNLDLFWPFADRILGGWLHYEQSWRESMLNLFTAPGKNVRVNYPFELATGKEVILPIWLFSIAYLRHAFDRVGLKLVDRRGVHAITNLFPSTVLHRAHPGAGIQCVYRPLVRFEAFLCGTWPFWRLGCSVVYTLTR